MLNRAIWLGIALMVGENTNGSQVVEGGRCFPFLSPLVTQSGARVTLLKPGLGENWIFLPGGPGLGAEYLATLGRELPVRGSVWSVDYPGTFGEEKPEHLSIVRWRESLREVVAMLDSPIPVGHSFGGMLLLATPLQSPLKGVVLMDTAPNDAWISLAGQSGIQTAMMDELELRFTRNPSDDLFRELFSSWGPYYFTPAGMEAGARILGQNSFRASAYQLGREQFFKEYKNAAWLPGESTPTLLIAGAEDKLTPLSLFDRSGFLSAPKTRVASIPNAGHFPWIENPERVLREFQDFDSFLHQ